jgi:hypothetical protein
MIFLYRHYAAGGGSLECPPGKPIDGMVCYPGIWMHSDEAMGNEFEILPSCGDAKEARPRLDSFTPGRE